MKLFIPSKKQLGYLQLSIFQKSINFQKNQGSPKKGLNKISLAFRLRGLSHNATFMFAQNLRIAWLFTVKVF